MVESVPLSWRLQRQRYNLIGTRCATCDERFFPPRNFCPSCRRKGKIEPFQFSGRGSVESFTVIRVAPSGFESQTPYAVGIIKLDEGTSISGQIVGDVTRVEMGKRVRPVFRRIREDGKEGVIHYGVKWALEG
ncbi:MAG: Zn-ribbon domain-containing OB-fold protein [Candidatus Aenigmarchaeota archaeon]|nr:Zn-ribbon domain-containing OB-fold protein [Candidatus Aenigmarchaeota archaeon]